MGLTIEIDNKRIADLLCEGFEGGIGYWAKIVGYEKPVTPGTPYYHTKYTDYPLNGGAVFLEEEETDEPVKHRLDMEAIQRGLKVMQEKYPRHFGNWLAENDDAETGDVFIQCCIFGKIVYG
jgi:hypothetical protein